MENNDCLRPAASVGVVYKLLTFTATRTEQFSKLPGHPEASSSLLLDLIDPTVGNPTVGKYGRNSGGPLSRGGRRINRPR